MLEQGLDKIIGDRPHADTGRQTNHQHQPQAEREIIAEPVKLVPGGVPGEERKEHRAQRDAEDPEGELVDPLGEVECRDRTSLEGVEGLAGEGHVTRPGGGPGEDPGDETVEHRVDLGDGEAEGNGEDGATDATDLVPDGTPVAIKAEPERPEGGYLEGQLQAPSDKDREGDDVSLD